MNRTNTAEFDFILSKMGYTNIPLVQRAVVFFKILQETQVPYRRYYRTHNKLRSGLTPDAVDISICLARSVVTPIRLPASA